MRVFHLGTKGEEAALHLADVYDLSSGFEPCLIISPHGQALDELRRRLAEKAGRLEHWPPGPDLGERVTALTTEISEGERPVVWLQQRRFDPDPWRHALASLNGQRDVYAREAPFMWVIAGPPDLVRLVHQHAMHVLTGIAVRRNLYEAPTRLMPAPSRPLRWLHLSDFHFQALERWDRRATLKALLRHAEDLKERDLGPDFVLITGDIAWSGQKKEYEQAERFFTELAETLNLEPRQHFFLVPGNHDVDRKAIGPADDSILDGLKNQEAIERVLGDPPTMGLLSRRLEAFYAFTERFLGTARGWQGDRPWRVDVREIDDLQVGILQLNSAWASGRAEEQGKLLVGEAQVQETLETAGGFLRIALVHHPTADLADVDRQRVETLLSAADGIHFLLRGHLHRSGASVTHTPDGALVELAAGATYVGGEYPKTHFLTEVDLTAGEARIHFFVYSPESGGFWAPDTRIYKQVQDGVWTFELPPELKLDAEAAGPQAAPLSEARRATLTARYRATAAAVHGTVQFVGFADSSPRPNVEVQVLFVPLRLTVEGATDAEAWTTSELLRRLVGHAAGDETARIVVLGDPGSGKTTLCRFAAVVIAGGYELEGVAIEGDLLPLFLPLREYVRSCRESGDRPLLAFLTEQARNHLQLPVSEAFLTQALEDGRAVLLLDGLDEVGSAGEREVMRERVQAFCRAYPAVATLVTSRIAGYDEAPLPRGETDLEAIGPGLHGAGQMAALTRGGFTHLQLAPFDDGDLERFVSRWYAVREPDDPLARDRGIANLTAAIRADYRVQELARNPMLATLIALVHRSEARLPGERAALYELCVKTFLETWPAARRRQFREIDERLQRAYLEALAYHMQSSRKGQDREVTIERQALIAALVDIVEQRQGKTTEREVTEGLIERWVRFLEEGTGLLVEQQPGIFAFFHLSFMEYLAARGMETVEDLVEAIGLRHRRPTWRNVCLLAVGHRATDKPFLDRLFGRIAGEEQDRDRWSFLLQAMREEADFDDEQRAELVYGCADRLLDLYQWPSQFYEDQITFDEILRLSMRHASWARSWIHRGLATAGGEKLQALVALRKLREEETLGIVHQRSDAAAAAASLLDFWPRTAIGEWAANTIEPELALVWAKGAIGHDLIAPRSMLALGQVPVCLRPALVVGLTRSAQRWSSRARACIESLAKRQRPGGRGLPVTVRVEPGGSIVMTVPASPWITGTSGRRESVEAPRLYFARRFARRIALAAVLDSGVDFAIDYSPDNLGSVAMFYPPKYTGYKRKFASDIQHEIGVLLHHCATDDAGDLARYFTIDFRSDFAIDFADELDGAERRLPSPVDEGKPRGQQRLRWAAIGTAETEAMRRGALVPARLAGEVWAAAVATLDLPLPERAAWIHRRIQNTWLLLIWPAVDQLLDPKPPEDALALYLALGWTQATTTWQWPATDRWISLLATGPPDDWLPRSQWHLCWLLHNRDDEAHQQGLREALDEGLNDEARPGIAVALRELFFEPGE